MSDSYAFGKVVPVAVDAAVASGTAALKDQGFGVLSDIDVAATLKAKIGADPRMAGIATGVRARLERAGEAL